MLKSGLKIIDVVYKYPRTEEVFREYDHKLGACVLCEHLFDTVHELAVRHDIDLEELMTKLERSMSQQV